MIGQCLSNKNENATVSKSKNFLDLNKPLVYNWTIFVKYKRKCYYSYFANFFEVNKALLRLFCSLILLSFRFVFKLHFSPVELIGEITYISASGDNIVVLE